MRNVCFILFFCSSFTSFWSQKLPVIKPEEIKDKGKNKTYYYLKDGYKYIPNSKIIDWYASFEKIQMNEEFNPQKMYFVENSKFLNGKKNGEFDISLIVLSKKETSLGPVYWLSEGQQIMTGNYLNNQLNGVISTLTFIDFKSVTGVLNILYSDGKISNQTIVYPNTIVCENSPYYDLKLELKPTVVFENGSVKELVHIEKNELPYKKLFLGDKIRTIRYTHDPLCFNSFSFKTSSYMKDVMNVNVNKFSIEMYTEKLVSGNLMLDGNYRLYRPRSNDKTFDTLQLVATYTYLDGKRNGLARIWDETKNGLAGHSPMIEQSYKNDLLHGESKLFFSDGKIALQANFKNGFLFGEVKSYTNGPNFKVYSLDGIARRSENGEGGILMINHINESRKWGNELIESVALIKERNGKITEFTDYGLFSKAFYVVDSLKIDNGTFIKYSKVKDYVSVYNNNFEIVKKYYDPKDPSKTVELLYIDEAGKQVYSLTQAVSAITESKKALQKEADKINNQIVRCHYCNVEAKLGTTVSNGDCDCYKVNKNGVKESTSLYIREVWPFCSRKCLADWEKQMCKRNGYLSE